MVDSETMKDRISEAQEYLSILCIHRPPDQPWTSQVPQGETLGIWILATKLPLSAFCLNVAVDFRCGHFAPWFPRHKCTKYPPKPPTTPNKTSQKIKSQKICSDLLGSGFGRTDFSRISIFGSPDFFADFLAGFCLPQFCGKKCPEKSSRKIPGKILQNLHNKNPRHISAEGPGQDLYRSLVFFETSLVSPESLARGPGDVNGGAHD